MFKIKKGHSVIEIGESDENLLIVLSRHNIFINAYCGGRGMCKKCSVRFLDHAPEPKQEEIGYFGKDKLNYGFRLACLHKASSDATIEVYESSATPVKDKYDICADKDLGYIAVDIGTTTIYASLIFKKRLVETNFILNPQVAFGSDVMMRITYSNNGYFNELCDILEKGLNDMIDYFHKRYNYPIDFISFCGNPTVLAFLLKNNPRSIGEFPYEPTFYGFKWIRWHGFNAYIPPVVDAFLGADITVGLLNVDLSSNFLFIDIGTNCEFVINTSGKLLSASVPAGPALEGASIDYGMVAKEGAIEHVDFKGSVALSVIGDQRACGITGSGLISTIAMLRHYGLIDKNGVLVDAWEAEADLQLISRLKIEGFYLDYGVYITQHSIREFQLVKASINSGLKLLSELYNIDLNGFDKVYISGGFTKSVDRYDIINSELLDIEGEFVFLGNSALKGLLKIFCKRNRKRIENIYKNIEYINIANQDAFENFFIESMGFK